MDEISRIYNNYYVQFAIVPQIVVKLRYYWHYSLHFMQD